MTDSLLVKCSCCCRLELMRCRATMTDPLGGFLSMGRFGFCKGEILQEILNEWLIIFLLGRYSKESSWLHLLDVVSVVAE